MIIPNLTKKLKKNKRIVPEWTIYSIILLILSLTFITLQPKVSSTIFQIKRSTMIESYITKVTTTQTFDAKVFWEFREFYSPGHFIFEKEGLKESLVNSFTKETPVAVKKTSLTLPFLHYDSPYLKSMESLTSKKSVDEIIAIEKLEKEKILKKSSSVLLYRYKNNSYLLVYVLPESEMKKANGFLDYRDKDRNWVKKRNWVTLTLITSN